VSTCGRDKALAWPAIVAWVVVSAVLQLTLVSGVWLPPTGGPSGRLKLAIYFAQVGRASEGCWGVVAGVLGLLGGCEGRVVGAGYV
jgi:hypothetical protein